ncbi:MAG: hypothetical protein KGP28_08545 [Bdellovibrionales bacterium]|nr:hypothetical protein [Bdellovibrionales bacterium]
MKVLFFLVVLALSGLALVSCGVSPLLHHESPNREPQSEPDSQNQDASAPAGPRVSCDFWFLSQNLCASLTWVRKPTSEEPGEFSLSFWNKNQNSDQTVTHSAPLADKVFVKLWMPDMGHGSSPVTTNQAFDSNGTPRIGVFRSTGVFFIMGGKWEIIVQLKDASGGVLDSSKMIFQVNH